MTDEQRQANHSSCSYQHDQQLVVSLLHGDALAWQRFVADYGRLIRARVSDVARSFGLTADSAAIDDATADLFSTLVANQSAVLRAFAGRSSLGTYLAVVATRVATRSFARKRRQTHCVAQTTAETCVDRNAKDPILDMLQREEQEWIVQLLDELPERQREVVRLFHLEGQSYAEISAALGMPIGSIGVTLTRAQEKLKQRMASRD